MASKLTGYQASIRGNYMTVYHAEFPMMAILSAPEGWRFCRVTEWRKNCPDQCWRIIFIRAALSESSS